MTKKSFIAVCSFGLFACVGCQTKHEIEMKPIEVKPMEMTLNINLNIKMVNSELNELFGETEDRK